MALTIYSLEEDFYVIGVRQTDFKYLTRRLATIFFTKMLACAINNTQDVGGDGHQSIVERKQNHL